jgi:hypothetical protein
MFSPETIPTRRDSSETWNWTNRIIESFCCEGFINAMPSWVYRDTSKSIVEKEGYQARGKSATY